MLAEFHAYRLEPQPLDIWLAADREQNLVRLNIVAALHVDHQHSVVALLDRVKGRVELEVDALGQADLEQAVAELLVVPPKDRVGAVDDRHVGTELVEDAGELIGDIAAPRDHDALGQVVEMKHFVRADRMFRPGKVGHQRPRSSRHAYDVRGVTCPRRQADFGRPC